MLRYPGPDVLQVRLRSRRNLSQGVPGRADRLNRDAATRSLWGVALCKSTLDGQLSGQRHACRGRRGERAVVKQHILRSSIPETSLVSGPFR